MEIILKQDIIGLGYKNDIVNVKSGYGRNFLIPTGKAVIASPAAKKQLAEPASKNINSKTTRISQPPIIPRRYTVFRLCRRKTGVPEASHPSPASHKGSAE